MTKDPVLTCFLLSMFGLSIAASFVRDFAKRRLVKWLHLHHRDRWREIGRPGTFLFKGEPGNGYSSRTAAFRWMDRTRPLHGLFEDLADGDEVGRCLRQHRLSGIFAVVFLWLFVVGIFYGVARDQIRGEPSSDQPRLDSGGRAAGK